MTTPETIYADEWLIDSPSMRRFIEAVNDIPQLEVDPGGQPQSIEILLRQAQCIGPDFI